MTEDIALYARTPHGVRFVCYLNDDDNTASGGRYPVIAKRTDMKLSESRRLPDGSYDLTERPMSDVLDEFEADKAMDWPHSAFEEYERRIAALEAEVAALKKRLDDAEAGK